jgi:hypothetical protein
MKSSKWCDSKYFGMTVEEIKNGWNENGKSVSQQGTNMHFNIECFMNQELPDDIEYTHENLLKNYYKEHPEYEPKTPLEDWDLFIKFVSYYPDFIPYRTEWLVYDEMSKICGSIDMVYFNKEDNTLNIFDWKRSKKITKDSFGKYAKTECINHIPDANYFHYSLQLNIYKAILEKNYGFKVKDLNLIILHPENKNNSFESIKVIDLSNEVKDLFEYRISQLEYLEEDLKKTNEDGKEKKEEENDYEY